MTSLRCVGVGGMMELNLIGYCCVVEKFDGTIWIMKTFYNL
jgi:hypothetical protein